MTLDRILTAAATGHFPPYALQHVSDAVNALLPLGKEGALKAIESYLAQQDLKVDPQRGLFLVLRILFEVPADVGFHLPLSLGVTSPPPPSTPQSLPHFPLVLIDDRPLLMISSFSLAEDSEPITAHLDRFRAAGFLRKNPLKPSQSVDSVLDQFNAVFQLAYGTPPGEGELGPIKDQLSGAFFEFRARILDRFTQPLSIVSEKELGAAASPGASQTPIKPQKTLSFDHFCGQKPPFGLGSRMRERAINDAKSRDFARKTLKTLAGAAVAPEGIASTARQGTV